METIHLIEKPIVHLKLNRNNGEQSDKSGCAVIEFYSPNSSCIHVETIAFYNYYTAILSIKAKLKNNPREANNSKWRTVLRNYSLMPSPYTDEYAESNFVLKGEEFRISLKDVIAIRFILQQPSVLWKEFRLNDVRFFGPSSSSKVSTPFSSLFSTNSSLKGESEASISHYRLANQSNNTHQKEYEAVANRLAHMWTLSAFQYANAPTNKVGNYEKDGIYEGTLLSFS